jgi:hypothetical protein
MRYDTPLRLVVRCHCRAINALLLPICSTLDWPPILAWPSTKYCLFHNQKSVCKHASIEGVVVVVEVVAGHLPKYLPLLSLFSLFEAVLTWAL